MHRVVGTNPDVMPITNQPLSDCRGRGDLTLVYNWAAERRAPAANPARIGQPPQFTHPRGVPATWRTTTVTAVPATGNTHPYTAAHCILVATSQQGHLAHVHLPCDAEAGDGPVGLARCHVAHLLYVNTKEPTPREKDLTGGGKSGTVCVGPSSPGDKVFRAQRPF